MIARSETYVENFLQGFSHQNSRRMEGGSLKMEEGHIFSRAEKGRKLGCIDGYFVTNEDVLLRDMLPKSSRLADEEFIIRGNSQVIIELATFDDRGRAFTEEKLSESIGQIIHFNLQLINGETTFENVSSHVLLLVFHGANEGVVFAKFQEMCREANIQGMAAYVSFDAAKKWEANLIAEEERRRATELSLRSEDNVRREREYTTRATEDTRRIAELTRRCEEETRIAEFFKRRAAEDKRRSKELMRRAREPMDIEDAEILARRSLEDAQRADEIALRVAEDSQVGKELKRRALEDTRRGDEYTKR
jgi:hypothetical protein